MPKYMEIANYLLTKIENSEIKTEERMPTIRELAELFQCSKVTAVRAYAELQQRHIVFAVPQDGYYLVNNKHAEVGPKLVNFISTTPDDTVLPYQEIEHCLNGAIHKYQHALFNYAPPQGLPSLIAAMKVYLEDYQIFAKPDNLFITAGAKQTLNILAAMPFPNNKNNILVEQPTYNGLVKFLEASKFPVYGVTRNFSGLDLAELEQHFAQNNIKLFYTVPRFHNPLGTSLNKNERKAILKLAAKYDVYIIEDDYLSDLELQNNAYSLYYEDMNDRVIYIKTFSKILLPGLRIAAAVIPEVLVKHFTEYKKWIDLSTSILSQGALEIYIKSGMIKTHRKKMRQIYAEKMKLLNELVKTAPIPHICWHIPKSGFFACGEFLRVTDIDKLIKRLKEKNILINNICENYIDTYYNDRILKLSISKVSLDDISYGIDAIGDEIKKIDE